VQRGFAIAGVGDVTDVNALPCSLDNTGYQPLGNLARLELPRAAIVGFVNGAEPAAVITESVAQAVID
jgi:hypothetical protein